MAYTNFIPEIWAESIERELERNCIFAEDCNRKYEGKVSRQGDTVHILGVGRPTIKTLARANASNDIDGPEEVEDTSVILVIDQIRYFNYMVGDIDKAQAVGGIMDALSQETSEGLANEVDTYIAELVDDENVDKVNANAVKVTNQNALTLIDDALTKLYLNDVKPSTEIVVAYTPNYHKLAKQDLISKDTDNSDFIKRGIVAKYGNATIKMSNNVYVDSNDVEHVMVRTKRAIAYVQPLTHTEAYRPEKKFADAVKGFILFGAKIVRPKEIVDLNVKYTD